MTLARDGVWRDFHSSGTLKSLAYYEKGKLNGIYTSYYDVCISGIPVIHTEGQYYNNKKEGCWISYHQNRKKESEGYYVCDMKHGRWIYYTINGLQNEIGQYRNDKKQGKWVDYKKNYKYYIDGEDRTSEYVIYQRILHGRKMPALTRPVNEKRQCAISLEDISGDFFVCCNPKVQHMYDATTYIQYVEARGMEAVLCPLDKTYYIDSQLYTPEK